MTQNSTQILHKRNNQQQINTIYNKSTYKKIPHIVVFGGAYHLK